MGMEFDVISDKGEDIRDPDTRGFWGRSFSPRLVCVLPKWKIGWRSQVRSQNGLTLKVVHWASLLDH